MRISLVSLLYICLACAWQSSSAQFTDRAAEKGVDHKYISSDFFGGGVAIFDINNDLRPDLYLTGGVDTDRLYLNNGNGFTRKVLFLAPEDFEYFDLNTMGVAAGDVNNDGYDDIFLCTNKGMPNVLLINNGDETFDALSPEESGIMELAWSLGASFGDVNLDGWLDIYVTNYVDTIRTPTTDTATGTSIFNHAGYRNYLYINNGDLTFEERSEEYGIVKRGTSLAGAFTDYDNDADPDLYVVNDFGHFVIPNELYRNNWPVDGLEDVSEAAGADVGLFGMGLAIGDFDNDLDLDYYMTNIGRNALLMNLGDGSFTDHTYAAGVADSVTNDNIMKAGWGTGFFDYNNDGLLDLYVSNGHIPAAEDIYNADNAPNALFRNEGDGTFLNVARTLGIADPSVCRGAAYGDLDGDGDLDLVFVPVGSFPNNPDPGVRKEVTLYYNETVNSNHWAQFKLVGDTANRNGYGSHIFLYDENGKVQLREADGGSGHASSSGPFVHFGLGSAEGIDSVVVIWPGGKRTVYPGLAVDELHILEESPSIISSVADDAAGADIQIYPNPTGGIARLQISGPGLSGITWSGTLANAVGKPMRRWQKIQDDFEIDLRDFAPGMYYLRLDSGGKRHCVLPILKE